MMVDENDNERRNWWMNGVMCELDIGKMEGKSVSESSVSSMCGWTKMNEWGEWSSDCSGGEDDWCYADKSIHTMINATPNTQLKQAQLRHSHGFKRN